jgi:hypothetical protein
MFCKRCNERPAQVNDIFCKGCRVKINYLEKNKKFFSKNNPELAKIDKIEKKDYEN